MALRILVGCCIFGAGWYAVDKVRPGLLPHIYVAGKITSLCTYVAFAIEDKDTKDTAIEGTDVGEPGSATQGHEAPADVLRVGYLENIYSMTARMWSCAHSLSEHLMDTLVPTDCQRRLRAAWTAVGEWTSVIVSEKVRVLMASIVCFAFSRLCCGGTVETNSSDDGKSPENPVPATAVGWKSIFSVLDMARLSILGLRHEGGYIYPRGKVADQLSREDAAAAVIQRWVRTEFKRWLQNGASSRSRIETPPPNSQGWIDKDHGAVVSTVLEHPRVSANALRPPEAERRSDAELSSGKCPSESSDQGGDDEASIQVLEGRKRLSLSAAKLRKDVLRLKSTAEQRGTKGPISIQP